jgi:flagellum-specific ATP synthase
MEAIKAEVVGFRNDHVLLMPLGTMHGIHPGSTIINRGEKATVTIGASLLGRVIDGLGRPLDQKNALPPGTTYSLYADPPNPLLKRRICNPLDLGIRAINALLTCGQGQRLGIFAGSGVGKSVLLGSMAKYAQADINVIALIGERGREVREFLERDLGSQGLQKSVVVVATPDQPPLLRVRGAYIATAIAEYFRDQGQNVLLMMDSLTRFAMAQREVGLSVGEPPLTKGYTPSVFASLPKLLERAGTDQGTGSITGLYTVLTEGDEANDPIADTVRSIVDGHIILSRRLASKNHYPAIEILPSLSRVMTDITASEHQALAQKLREILAVYSEAEDLINIGAYVQGSNVKIDEAITKIGAINTFLRQTTDEFITFGASLEQMQDLFNSPS